MKIFLTITFISFCCVINGYAQNQCTQTLDRARSLFNEGHLYEVEEVLEPCLKKGFTRDQKIQAYHLLTLTFLYLNEHEKAEANYMSLLQLDPEFDVENDNDKIEIVYLDQKFITTPIFILNGRLGINSTYPFIINDYDLNQSDPETYESRLGYSASIGLDMSINEKWKIGAEFLFKRTSFYYYNRRFNEDNLEVTQVQNFLSLPVSVKYMRKVGNLYPYVYGGVSYDYLFSSSGHFKLDNIKDGLPISVGENPNQSLSDLRRSFSLNLIGGVGLKKRIGYYYVFAEFRFIGGLKNLVKDNNRYPLKDDYLYDFDALYKFTYVDDDFRLNTFGFTIGFEKPYYKPRRISAQKSFFKKIFK